MSKLTAKMRHLGLLVALLLPLGSAAQQQDTTENKLNHLTLDANLMTRGELRYGGFPSAPEFAEDHAQFVMARTRLSVGYQRSFLEAKITAQHSGVWGQQGKGAFNLSEAWAKLRANNGLFAIIGRQELAYDDERILGRNDWAMAANAHDAARLGYEGHGHKAHVILAFNQQAWNINGGTIYTTSSGAQVHRSMVTGWYHYDFKRIPLGASLLFMDVGLQNDQEEDPKVEHQQLLGGYVKYNPKRWNVEVAYYRQMGTDEFHIPIKAWMTSVKADYDPTRQWRVTAGYDYLSGDPNPNVPQIGTFGLAQHTVVRGFNTIYGSHHQFYGAMDFFYVRAYYGGYTPGLQNLYASTRFRPIQAIDCSAAYHFLLTAERIDGASRTLGHEMELTASYTPIKFVKISAGYTYMHGSSTLELLQRVKGKNHMHWAWLMLTVNPRILSFKW